MRDIITNNMLMHMGIKETSICLFCGRGLEYPSYLYDRCVRTRRLWERLKEWVEYRTGIRSAFNLEHFLFRHDNPDDNYNIRFLHGEVLMYIYRN